MAEPDASRGRMGRRLADHLARLVVEGVGEYAIVALNPEGQVVTWSDGAEEITGYPRHEALGRPFQSLLGGEGRSADVLRDAALHGRHEEEGWRVRRDGSRFWARDLVTALHDETGRLVAYAVVLRDRTEQRRAEEARRRSEEIFASIVNTSADGIVSVDEDQRIVLFNPAAEGIFGYRTEELVGRPLTELIPEPFRAGHHALLREFAACGCTSRPKVAGSGRQLYGRRRDGEVFPMEGSIAKVRVDGEWLFTIVLRDVSERVRAAKAREFLSRAAVVLDASLDYEDTLRHVAQLAVPDLADWCIVYVVDPDGSLHRLEVAHRDPSMEEVLRELQRYQIGPGSDHPAARAVESGEPELVPEAPPSLVESVAQDEEHLRVLRRLELRSMVMAPLMAHGRALGAIGLFASSPHRRFDEGDRDLAAEVGRRAGMAISNARLYREARQAVRARDEVVSVVSHDLRNPLNAILMGSQLLEELLSRKGLNGRLHELVSLVSRSAERMNRLIQDLLDISRLESGRLRLEPAPAEVASLLDDAHAVLAPLAADRGLELALEVEPELPAVLADRDRLHQVLSNLVGNALRFTPRGGRVTMGARAAEGAVELWVADTGSGIPADHIPHLFDRFWQASRSDREGIGLGLPIVKGIVEGHGGRVHVESRVGEGSVFRFTLPRAEPPPG